MASKILVGLHQHGPFQGKKREEIISLNYVGTSATNPELRVKHLEQNIRFLQEQHQIMLTGLHREVEVLRRRNRDLQFQMVFSKGSVSMLQSTPTSSPEEDCPRKPTVSPGQINITPLQIELLERDMAELKTNLGEARTKSVYLQGVVDEQKKRITELEISKSLVAEGRKLDLDSKQSANFPDSSENLEAMKDKLEVADRLVRRLRRENEEQRKEIVSLRTSVGKGMSDNRRGDGSHRGYTRNIQNQYSQTSRFPPLHSQNYWHTPRHNNDYYKSHDKGGGSGHEAGSSDSSTTLPLLKERNSGPTTSGFSSSTYNPNSGGNSRRGYPHHRGSRTYRNNYKGQQDRE